MGPRESDAWHALLDATEQVLRSEGYAAATSRRIAEVAGVKQQLVYYYFKTMDDLLLAAFKRQAATALRRLESEVEGKHPIKAIWTDLSESMDGKLAFEFMALANHHKGFRREVSKFVRQTRELQAKAIQRQWQQNGVKIEGVSPAAAAFMLYGASLMLAREEAMGITEGHADVRALIRTVLKKSGETS